MGMARNLLAALVLAGTIMLPAGPARAETVYLRGKIGEHNVAASLEHLEDRLTGWYFYASPGTADPTGGAHGRTGCLRLGGAQRGPGHGHLQRSGRPGALDRHLAQDCRRPALAAEPRGGPQAAGRPQRRLRLPGAPPRRQVQLHLQLRTEANGDRRAGAEAGIHPGLGGGDDGDEQTCSLGPEDLRQVPSTAGFMLRVADATAMAATTPRTIRAAPCASWATRSSCGWPSAHPAAKAATAVAWSRVCSAACGLSGTTWCWTAVAASASRSSNFPAYLGADQYS